MSSTSSQIRTQWLMCNCCGHGFFAKIIGKNQFQIANVSITQAEARSVNSFSAGARRSPSVGLSRKLHATPLAREGLARASPTRRPRLARRWRVCPRLLLSLDQRASWRSRMTVIPIGCFNFVDTISLQSGQMRRLIPSTLKSRSIFPYLLGGSLNIMMRGHCLQARPSLQILIQSSLLSGFLASLSWQLRVLFLHNRLASHNQLEADAAENLFQNLEPCVWTIF